MWSKQASLPIVGAKAITLALALAIVVLKLRYDARDRRNLASGRKQSAATRIET